MTVRRVALAHDYLTQRGGAERVVACMLRTYPGSPLYTTLFDPAGTFPELAAADVRTTALDRVGLLRAHHRLALPLLAPAVSAMHIDAEVVVASTSGWAHGFPVSGRKVVYCHAPARWLYQPDRYLGLRPPGLPARIRRAGASAALGLAGGPLRRWDRRAAHSAHRYLVNSTVTRDAVQAAYGIEAEVLHPPPALLPGGAETPVEGIEPGFVLCVARLLAYKNVDTVVRAAALVPGARLVVVGEGPERGALEALAARSGSTTLLGRVDDPQLRWLYRNCVALAAASYEDYGLSPLEAAAFGRPAVTLRAGGFLDTVIPGVTGQFFERVDAGCVAEALEAATRHTWDAERLSAHAASFSEARFSARLEAVVDEEAGRLGAGT